MRYSDKLPVFEKKFISRFNSPIVVEKLQRVFSIPINGGDLFECIPSFFAYYYFFYTSASVKTVVAIESSSICFG